MMFKPLVVAAAFSLVTASPVLAQGLGDTSNPEYRSGAPIGSNVDPNPVETRRQTSASRLRDQGRSVDPAAPTPEQVKEAASALAAVSAPDCRVTEASLLGARQDGTKLFEVACASGPGYILEAIADAPKANDCVQQWSYGVLAREADPAADVGLQCTLPGNQNNVQVIAAYGREAGLECEVDQAVASGIGVYEIGCAGRDGWRLEKTEAGWKSTTCWQFALIADAACRYSSREESAAEWPKLVAGTDAAACVIEDLAWMGENPERGAFYELKCASGDGVIVRFKDGAGQQTYSCVDAPQVFRRPCTLTQVE
jgi:hypothetical protein